MMNGWLRGALLGVFAVAAGSALADEGMWTLDHLPVQQMQSRYGFTPTPQWIDLVQHATLRLAEGCSGSFVSAEGLVMTNHHCANGCLSQLSGKTSNLMKDGFITRDEHEPRCPEMELNQLARITDVTDRVNTATRGKDGAARIKAQHAIDSAIEKECIAGDAGRWRCDVVSLYHGGRYALYKYRRYQDVRLVFAPEQGIAFFGGDPDNFNFPRYDLDVAFLRAYVDGRPAKTPRFLKFDVDGPKAGEMTFVVGNPGSTQRETPWTSLLYMRDHLLTPRLAYLSEARGQLWQYSRLGAQQAREAQDALFGLDNTLKVYKGWLETLSDSAFIARKQKDDAGLQAWIAATPARRTAYGTPWESLEKAQQRESRIHDRYTMIEGGQAFASQLFGDARLLVRGAAERKKPDAGRLPAYRDANLPALEQRLASTAPVYPAYEQTRLAWSLEKMRQSLGADDPFVHEVLGHKSPDQRARELTSGTRMADPAAREKLWKGGEKAIGASSDPMIMLARMIDPEARQLRTQYENDVEAPSARARESIARARFERDGTNRYPDATFTPRLSYGKVEGWKEKGVPVPPFTDLAGLYRRATGADPYRLPASWIEARASLDMSVPMDFVTDNDIIGGNSGSPVIDRQGRAVGLIFDGNIHSLGGDFTFDEANNRAIAVDTAALVTALRKVYKLAPLADELATGHR